MCIIRYITYYKHCYFYRKDFQKLSNLKVKQKEIYRAVRYDINLNKFNNLDEDFLFKKVIRINYPHYTYDLRNKKKFKIKKIFLEYFKKLFDFEFYKILFKINIFSLIKTFNIFIITIYLLMLAEILF